MGMRKRTLRSMTPEARKLARLVGELESATRRIKNMLPNIQVMEMWARAEGRREAHLQRQAEDVELKPTHWRMNYLTGERTETE